MNCPFSTTRRRGRPARADAVMSREDILRRAFLAFARQGYDSVSQRQLASECGVSDSLLHHHFGSKQQLWQEAADSVFAPLVRQLQDQLETLARQGNAASTLRNNLPLALKLMMTNPAALQFLFREGEGGSERSEYLRATYVRPYLERLDELFAQGVAAGQLRDLMPATRHVLVMGFMRALVIPGVLQSELDEHQRSHEALSAYIDEVAFAIFSGVAHSSFHETPSTSGEQA
jgi:TetR/AcrR family transcriptional regulator